MGKTLPRLRILHAADGWTPEFARHFKPYYDGILAREITDPDMRESAERLKQLSDPRGFGRREPWGFVSLALVPQGRGWKVGGGICYEWYRGGRGALVTYIMVAPHMRRRGLAQRLMQIAFQQLRKISHLHPGTTLPLFAETEIVDAAAPAHEQEAAAKRFSALAGIGFKSLDFPYVQPPLSPGKAHVRNLTLMAYSPGDAEVMDAAVIGRFLNSFYRALVGERLDRDEPCQRVLAHLKSVKSVALKPLILHNARMSQGKGNGRDERRGTLA
ncbi:MULTISPECIES: GNAT family N-acetyltransferase [Rhodomicrobium]|uniref:GNAT family N-acetyltransferase n=1 Tax=Rhodomicrobium TaxID=1068 RepID=UPI000B4A61A6|nr:MULTISPECIES: GNAT family N-acetyltransferase [Rhodomicrobium]